MERAKKKLSNKYINAMLIPGIGMNLYLYIELFYMSYFLTDVCHFGLGMVTFILTSTAAVDLVWVFVTGIMIEKAQFKKLGKYRAWYVIMPPIIMVFFTIMFFNSGNSNLAAAVIIMAFCLKTLAQDVVSAAVTGHISQMTDDPDERTLMNARRNQGSIIGQLLFSLIGLPVISWIGVKAGDTGLGYTGAAFLFSLACAVAHLIVFMITKDAPVAETEKIGTEERLSTGEMFKVFFHNTPLLVISFGDLLRFTAVFLISSTAAYYFTNVLKDPGAVSTYLTISTVMGVIGALCVNFVVKRLGKKNTYVACTIGYAVMLLVAYFICGEGDTVLFIILMAIGLFFGSMPGVVAAAMTSDTVIYTMYKDGKNARGFIMSMLKIPIKFGSMLQSIILPVGLSMIGYQAGAEATASVSRGIAGIMCLASGLCCLGCSLLVLFGYKLSDQKVKELTEAVEARSK